MGDSEGTKAVHCSTNFLICALLKNIHVYLSLSNVIVKNAVFSEYMKTLILGLYDLILDHLKEDSF